MRLMYHDRKAVADGLVKGGGAWEVVPGRVFVCTFGRACATVHSHKSVRWKLPRSVSYRRRSVAISLLYWLAFHLTGRCFACGRLVLLHTPWREHRCNRQPLPITLTEQGWLRAVADVTEPTTEVALRK
jgi:hypothetical protein